MDKYATRIPAPWIRLYSHWYCCYWLVWQDLSTFKTYHNYYASKKNAYEKVGVYSMWGGKSYHCSQSPPKCQNTRCLEGFNEIWPKILKALNQEVLWLSRVCQVAWCSGRTPEGWQSRVTSMYTKRDTRVNAPTARAYLSLDSLEKCMPSALKKDALKYNWSKLYDTQCGRMKHWQGKLCWLLPVESSPEVIQWSGGVITLQPVSGANRTIWDCCWLMYFESSKGCWPRDLP